MIAAFLVATWASIVVTLYIIEFTRLPVKLRIRGWQPLNRKPFNCEMCLPFWLNAAFLPFAIYDCYGTLILAALASMCTAGILTVFLLKLIRR